MSRYDVVNQNGEKKFDCGDAQAERMLALHQVRRTAKNSHVLQLVGFGREHEHKCRTHTSRSAFLGAIGRSQEYTTREHGRVTGFKERLGFPEDFDIFNAATLGAGASLVVRPAAAGHGGFRINSITFYTASGPQVIDLRGTTVVVGGNQTGRHTFYSFS